MEKRRATVRRERLGRFATQCRNASRGLLLLYGNSTFLQSLEGAEEVVIPLYDKIASDPRHVSVTCLARETIETRAFPGWSMGFRRLSSDFDSGPLTSESAREALLHHFSREPQQAHLNNEQEIAELRETLRRTQGGVEIARLV